LVKKKKKKKKIIWIFNLEYYLFCKFYFFSDKDHFSDFSGYSGGNIDTEESDSSPLGKFLLKVKKRKP
jgi:hypothetical protein